MLEQFYYLIALLIAILGLALLDRRFKLAFWHDKRATFITLAISVAVFTIWDVLGIALGIFYHAGSSYSLPLRILPEFPLEELLFLTLLCYNALLLYRGLAK